MPTPFSPSPAILSALLLLPWLSGGGAAAQGPESQDPQRGSKGDWELIQDRDERVSFTPQSASRALAALDQPDLEAPERAVILLTLGAAGALSERPLLQSWAMEGAFAERSAALLALGELGPSASGFLMPLALGDGLATGGMASGGEQLCLRECAILALLRTGWEEARNRLASLEAAQDTGQAPRGLEQTVAELLVFAVNPAGSNDQRAVRRLLELRWDAARSYGLIDGQSWSSRLLQNLGDDGEFLDALVLEGAAALGRAGVRDHLLQSLTEGRGAARLRAAVRAMPLELDQLVELGLWLPADDGEWSVLVEEIGLRGLDSLCGPLLERATLVEEAAPAAAGLLVRAGFEPALRIVTSGLKSNLARTRLQACLALAQAGATQESHLLRPLMEDRNPGVRVAAIAAGVRLGDREGPLFLHALLNGDEAQERKRCLMLLARPGAAMLVVPMLEEYAATLSGEERGLLSAVLLFAGRSGARETLRESLRGGVPVGQAGEVMLSALARRPTHEDLLLMEEIFPLEGRFAENRILALALLDAGSGSVLPLLRRALWEVPWDRSVLAAALLADVAGERALLEEAQSPPAHAGARDARRVGFAVGAWGGVEDVRRLERLLRRGSSDPTLQGAFLGALASRTH
ncbi:MAG TPA: hypothetical protein QF730_08430 [Planctomycetota bacterium]|nr:hypothetical protein [Planctomycetota bacterium]